MIPSLSAATMASERIASRASARAAARFTTRVAIQSSAAQPPQGAALVQGDVIGLVALDRVLRVILAGVVGIALVVDVADVHPLDPAADPSGFGIPADVIADLEGLCFGH